MPILFPPEVRDTFKKQYVLGFVFDQNRTHVALIHKDRPAWQKGKLNGIGGQIEAGETPIQAMSRECEEETGVLLPPDVWIQRGVLLIKPLEKDSASVVVFTSVTDSVLNFHSTTDETVIIFPLSRLGDIPNLLPNIRLLVSLCLHEELDTSHHHPSTPTFVLNYD